jgi:RimJ/RimL family protein N-acetyltransferase
MERRVRTRTGTEIIVRPIVAADHDALIELFDHLGPESRYSRFMFPAQSLTESEVNYFTDVDHHTHEALWALSESGEPVGTARYVCLEDRPGVAEIAVTIADGWHEHGVGTALLDLLAERATAEGVERFLAICMPSNRDMIDLVQRLGGERAVTRLNGSLIEVEAPLPGPPEGGGGGSGPALAG